MTHKFLICQIDKLHINLQKIPKANQCKVIGYKINNNTQLYFYTSIKQLEIEPCHLAPNKIKQLGINLTKYVQDLCAIKTTQH